MSFRIWISCLENCSNKAFISCCAVYARSSFIYPDFRARAFEWQNIKQNALPSFSGNLSRHNVQINCNNVLPNHIQHKIGSKSHSGACVVTNGTYFTCEYSCKGNLWITKYPQTVPTYSTWFTLKSAERYCFQTKCLLRPIWHATIRSKSLSVRNQFRVSDAQMQRH